jgi:hypothetical protein
MSRFSLPLVAGVLLVVMGCASEEDRVKQDQAVTEIEKLGGKVKRSEDDPDKPVVEVNLEGEPGRCECCQRSPQRQLGPGVHA